MDSLRTRIARLFSPSHQQPGHLWPRWIWLRALGLVFFSAFYSFAFQVRGLVGEQGILPAREYLASVSEAIPTAERFWLVPTLFWSSASDRALGVVVTLGLIASLALIVNLWPRLSIAVCTLGFLSIVAVLQEFSSYQSDGMLLEAGFLSLFFAPPGLWPGLGANQPPSRASRFLLQWEWFRIYFWSGVVKLASGDVHWRNFTAMDAYYENGPLPSWPGWYVQQWPHWYHAGTVALTLLIELVLVWAMFLPRRFRIALFFVVTPLQLGIIATANYAFLNYLVLALGVLLLDDDALAPLLRRLGLAEHDDTRTTNSVPMRWTTWIAAICLTWAFYTTIVETVLPGDRSVVSGPARAIAQFRIANQYGLFASMTEARYEIEFEGTADGRTWVPYPFPYKPQDPIKRPGVFAPYQPRFEWNLWFASLGPASQSLWIVLAQKRLMERSPAVLALFADDPLHGATPVGVRTMLWQYWFTNSAEKRTSGRWWRRQSLGEFTGTLWRLPGGTLELRPPGAER